MMPARPANRSRERRAVLLVLDSLGIGAAPDAARFGDVGADTFGHVAEACAAGRASHGRSGPLAIPRLAALGLVHASELATGVRAAGFEFLPDPIAAWGAARERSTGKDTTSGHWEMTGLPVLFDWGYFSQREESMPAKLLDELARRAHVPGFLGNRHASGTQIIEDLGEEHLRSGRPIVYTSADSVLQICAHEEAFGLERLYSLCAVARELVDEYRIGRVIARPFTGPRAGEFRRTANRHDYSVPPTGPTLLDALVAGGGTVAGVGKVPDIFANCGISRALKASGLAELMDVTTRALAESTDRSLVFTNLVDFDQEYGHRRDVAGYARALETFDAMLPALTGTMKGGDLLILTADHGNDPTWKGTDHTREQVPVLAYGPGIRAATLGRRESFADIGQTLAAWFGLPPLAHGEAFF